MSLNPIQRRSLIIQPGIPHTILRNLIAAEEPPHSQTILDLYVNQPAVGSVYQCITGSHRRGGSFRISAPVNLDHDRKVRGAGVNWNENVEKEAVFRLNRDAQRCGTRRTRPKWSALITSRSLLCRIDCLVDITGVLLDWDRFTPTKVPRRVLGETNTAVIVDPCRRIVASSIFNVSEVHNRSPSRTSGRRKGDKEKEKDSVLDCVHFPCIVAEM